MEAIMTATANMERASVGTYVEFSKVEVPLSVRKALFDKFKKTRPKGIDITDEEIQEMVNEVRYGKNN
jgi:hypothetical protein